MKLAEWMTLDDTVRFLYFPFGFQLTPTQTKMMFCSRIASQGLPPNQFAPKPALLDVKRRYETGEWFVPCFSLQCVGFDMNFYDALKLAVLQTRPTVSKPVPLQVESDSESNISSSAAAGEKRGRAEPAEPSNTSEETSAPAKKLKLL